MAGARLTMIGESPKGEPIACRSSGRAYEASFASPRRETIRSPYQSEPSDKECSRGTGVPHPVDLHVGARIRVRRLLLGMNQQTLAGHLGVTFQQVQKYEHGTNRISASRLSAVAEILDVPVSYFLADLQINDGTLSIEEKQSRERLQQPETIDLVRFYYAIADSAARQQFLDLVKAIAASR